MFEALVVLVMTAYLVALPTLYLTITASLQQAG